MNSEPCVRFGIRISPKMREKPADSRNSRPPKVMLLAVSTSQKLIPQFPALDELNSPRAPRGARSCRQLRLERWIVSRIDRLLEEPFLIVGPELTHILVGLNRLVD